MKQYAILACTSIALCWSGGRSLCRGQTSATDSSQQQMLDQIRAMQSQINDLKAKLEGRPTGEPAYHPLVPEARDPADEQATVGQVMRDAERRSSLDDLEPFTAGYMRNKGFVIRSDDGNFLLHPWAFIQVRNTTTYQDHALVGASSTASTNSTQNGFELPRAKFILDGNVFSPDLTYQFIWATSDTTGSLQLQDAWGRYHIPNTPFAFRAGQIRDPVDHEQLLFATRSLTPDRSIVNNVILNGDDIVKGASISYGYDTPSDWRTEVAVTSGERNFDTDFQPYPINNADWGVAGRFEWKFMGNWEDYTQFTSLADKNPLLVVGGGADYTETGAAGSLTHVVDAQFNLPHGLSLYGAYLGRYTRHNAGSPTTNGQGSSPNATAMNTYDPTVRLMAGYLIDDHWEPFVRYEYLHFDRHEIAAGTGPTVNDFTLGFNYYFHGHRAKVTAGATYLPNGSPVSNTLGDLLTSHKGEEIIIQAQFQLII